MEMYGTAAQMSRMNALASRASGMAPRQTQATVTAPIGRRTMPSPGNRRTVGYSRRYIGSGTAMVKPHQSIASHNGPRQA